MEQIYIKQLKKKFNVATSNKVIKLTYRTQLAMAHAGDTDEKTSTERIEASLKMTEMGENYLRDVLKLSDSQYEKIDDLDVDETVELVNYVIMRVTGLTDEEIEKYYKGADEKK